MTVNYFETFEIASRKLRGARVRRIAMVKISVQMNFCKQQKVELEKQHLIEIYFTLMSENQQILLNFP
jgi:hypothetical protein